jgi:carbon-monoxide dehydrogenase medium subunit
MYPASFRYVRPQSLDEAIRLLEENPEAKLLAGGHSLIPAMKLRLAAPSLLVDIGRLDELKGIREEDGAYFVGALTTHAEIERSSLPLLPLVAKVIGDPMVRNLGTIGGSLAHADPAADYPAAVLALEAEILAKGSGGERWIPAREFFQGMFQTALSPSEVLVGLRVPKLPGYRFAYEKFLHPASGYAVVGVAAAVLKEGEAIQDVRLGATGAAYTPFRLEEVEVALKGGKGPEEATRDYVPPVPLAGDRFASAEYRLHLLRVLARRALEKSLSG